MLISLYIVLGIGWCRAVRTSKQNSLYNINHGRSFVAELETQTTPTTGGLKEYVCKTKNRNRDQDLKIAARSNLFFTIAMFKSMTFKNDSFRYKSKWREYIILNEKYRRVTDFEENLPDRLKCGTNGKQDHGKNLIFSPFSIRSIFATIVIGMREAFNHLDRSMVYPYLSKRHISYRLFPGIDWTNNISKVRLYEYKNTDRLLAMMTEMTTRIFHSIKHANEDHEPKDDYPISNTIYVQKGFEILPDYQNIFKECLNVNVRVIDFFNSSLVKETAKKLSLGPSFLSIINSTNDNKTIPVSTLNFSFELKTPFNKEDSTTENFTTSFLPEENGNEYMYVVNATMMNQEGYFVICDFLNATAIRLPYLENEDYSLTVILPNENSNLYDIQPPMNNPFVDPASNKTNLVLSTQDKRYLSNMEKMNKCFRQMKQEYVKVSIPKFRFDQEYALKQQFTWLATETTERFAVDFYRRAWAAFRNQSEEPLTDVPFPMYADNETQPTIPNLLHKIHFELTHLNITKQGKRIQRIVTKKEELTQPGSEGIRKFVINRPFMFFVQEKISDAILIAGRIINPTDKEPTKISKPTTASSTESSTEKSREPTKSKKKTEQTTSKSKAIDLTSITTASKNKANQYDTTEGKIIFICIIYYQSFYN